MRFKYKLHSLISLFFLSLCLLVVSDEWSLATQLDITDDVLNQSYSDLMDIDQDFPFEETIDNQFVEKRE